MSDYIDRKTAINAMLHRFWDGKETLREIMMSIPAADVAPVVCAEWEVTPAGDAEIAADHYHCGHCKAFELWPTKFCCNCGAKMTNYDQV